MTDPTGLDAVQQRALLARGELLATELLAAHLDRIERLDGIPEQPTDHGVNAVVTRTADAARRRAAELDDARARGEQLGPLHGLVVAVKDLTDVAGVRTTYGSPVFADHVPDADHLVAARLRAAGAVLVGKTNTPEFGAGSHTFNPVFGVTRNPWDLTRSAGGSSGGAAAAVAAGFVGLADGSDVGGSLRNPPSFCGVVGLRPSPGRVPLTQPGHLHLQFPTAGPIGRCVADVALGLSVLAGPDSRSLTGLPEPGADFAPPLPAWTGPVRVAVSEDLGGLPLEPAVRDAVRRTADQLADAGWQVTADCPELDGVDACFETIRAWMFATDPSRALDRDARSRVKATVGEEIADGERLTALDLSAAFDVQTRLLTAVRDFFGRYDLLLAPTAQVLPFPVEQEYPTEVDGVAMHRYTDWMRVCSRLTVLGLPVLSLPAALSAPTPTAPAGLPIGVQLAAAPGRDLDLLRLASGAETVLGRLGPPPLG
jgi:amidase